MFLTTILKRLNNMKIKSKISELLGEKVASFLNRIFNLACESVD